MRYFCTYFDKNFLVKGLALYRSLVVHCPHFTLFILCFDTETFDLLSKMKESGDLGHIQLIRLEDFEDPKLLAAKETRTAVEYFWTCTPSLPLFILRKNPEIDMIAYVDADMYFYDTLDPIYKEFEENKGGIENSIMIIPHRFSDRRKHMEKLAGTYNVGLLIFKNDANGIECLEWWRNKCLEWCYARYEDGKFGDQLYLNDWPTRFKGVYVLGHEGVNVASWNIDSYHITKKTETGTAFSLTHKKTRSAWPLILYHFHGPKTYLSKDEIKFYPINILHKEVYGIYLGALNDTYKEVLVHEKTWKSGFMPRLSILRIIKQHVIKWMQDIFSK